MKFTTPGLFVAILALNAACLAQTNPAAPGLLGSFVEVFNENDSDALQAFLAEHSEEGTGIQEEVAYWAGVFREVGPLSFTGTAMGGPPGREREEHWHRGDVTGAWIGLRFDYADDGTISGRGVLRGVRPPVAPAIDRVAESALTSIIRDYLAVICAADHFSGSVIVARGGEPVVEEACGFADREHGIRNELSTPFRLASVSKLFTGVAIAQLVGDGLVSFDSPLCRFVPEYPSHIGDQVTIRHLLTHTSGIELDNNVDFNSAVGEAESMEELLSTQLAYIEQLNSGNFDNFAPLTRFDYTNDGIDLLGVIIERASGIRWSDYLRTKIFEPAGMQSTGADLLSPVADLAQSYTTRSSQGGGTLPPGTFRPLTKGESTLAWRIRPAGSAYSSAPDMLRFITAIRNCELLSCELVDEVTSPKVEIPTPPGIPESRAYGYTFGINDSGNGVLAIGHTGGAPGMSTVVQFYPDLGYTVIILSNRDRTQWWLNMRIQELIGAQ